MALPRTDLSPRESIRQGSKSFALASWFLPAGSRDAALELYRWCRNCDDLVDDARDGAEARERLAQLEGAWAATSEWQAPGWVDPGHRADFMEGLRMDVAGAKYRSLADLELYCYRVAGVVGLMMCPVIGAHPEHAPPHASALGKAMQLTNIARDVQADARLGRVYLPSDLASDLDAVTLAREPERALPAVRRLLEQADRWYAEGFRGLAWLPWRTALAIAVAGKVYQGIGHRLLRAARRNPSMAFRRRTVVSRVGKAFAVASAVVLLLRVKWAANPSVGAEAVS